MSFRIRRGVVPLPYAMAIGRHALGGRGALQRARSRPARGARWASTGRWRPVADVNNNPANPVINIRSFGEDPELRRPAWPPPSSRARARRAA